MKFASRVLLLAVTASTTVAARTPVVVDVGISGGEGREILTRGLRERVPRKLREAGLALVTAVSAEERLSGEGVAQWRRCVLEGGAACATVPRLEGVAALVAVEVSTNARGQVSCRLAARGPGGERLHEKTVSHHDTLALLGWFDAVTSSAAEDILRASGGRSLVPVRIQGWSIATVGMAFTAVGAAFGVNSVVQYRVLTTPGNPGPTSMRHAMELRDGVRRDGVAGAVLGGLGVGATVWGLLMARTPPGPELPGTRLQVVWSGTGIGVAGVLP